jgi:hypothetical protein
VQNPDLDYYNYKNINNKNARSTLLKHMEEKSLTDPFREFQPDIKRYTWRKANPLQQARLDFFILSSFMLPYCENVFIKPSFQSDHSIIIMQLKFNDFKHGKGLWKHNNSLLRDIQYVNEINKKIEDVKKQYAIPVYNFETIESVPNEDIQFVINDQLFLETLLMEIRGKSISYGSYKKKASNEREIQIKKDIEILENSETIQNNEKLEQLRNELNIIQENKFQGYILRSKVDWVIDGEKPSKLFSNLEKSNYVNKCITKIMKNDGTLITKQEEILNETAFFYESLYTCTSHGLEDNMFLNFVKDINIPTLSNTESKSLEGKIRLEEASTVLKNMKNNKSPGSSGFSAEFYKCFWNRIGLFVCRALNHAFISGNLSVIQTQGIITCIPKGDKPKQFLKNWRPITLLNTIYKIGSGCIANRIKIFLDKLINTDQTGFIKGRFIGENVRLIYDIMQYTEENNISGLLLLIDFEKAFDSLSWVFVDKTLSLFNFGEDIKRWFNIFYKDGISAICQNGFLSKFFSIQRGCRQGDPLSCYIFILCAEILSQKIRSNNNIKGIKMNLVEHKLSQFADDTSIILDGSASSLNETLDTLSTFTFISGLKVNFDKTKVVLIGKEKISANGIKTKWKLSWNQQNFDMLGFKFHVDLSKMIELNYKSKIAKALKNFNMWKRRIITPIGRIIVIKTLVLSLFNHLFVFFLILQNLIFNSTNRNFIL